MPFSDFDISDSSLAVLAKQNITEPTPIQLQAIPVMLDGRDIVGQAYTGSGKTLSFGLPLIEICEPDVRGIQAIVLTPTRELAAQVAGVISALAQPAGLSVALIYGGVGFEPQIEAIKRGAQIVVGTPGRVLDHLRRGSLNLSSIRVLVLDEADQMLDQGFAPDVERIIATTPRSRQTALFSATTPDWVRDVSKRYLEEPVYISTATEAENEPDIEHVVIEVWNGEKLPILLALLTRPTEGATLVFGRTRHGVQNLARRLQRLGFEVEALQGDLGQNARDRIVKRFREGRIPVLLATNVAARGLDMLNIEHVINYDMPETSELFTHRVGRTGRMGRSGIATTIIAATDLQKIREFERELGRKFPRMSAAQVLHEAGAMPEAPARAPAAQNDEMRSAAPQQQQQQSRRGSNRRPREMLDEGFRESAPRAQSSSSQESLEAQIEAALAQKTGRPLMPRAAVAAQVDAAMDKPKRRRRRSRTRAPGDTLTVESAAAP